MNLSRRNCPRCGNEMFPAYIMGQDTFIHLIVGNWWDKWKKRKSVGTISARVCPECGEISLYYHDLERLRDIIGKIDRDR